MNRGELLDRLSAVLFPNTCVFCGSVVEYEDEWCGKCSIPENEQLLEGGSRWIFTAAASPLAYTEGARDAVLALKERPDKRISGCLAGMMRNTLGRQLPGAVWDCTAPVPQSMASLEEKQHNHAGLLAKALARRLGVPLREDLLVRRNTSEKQSSLGSAQRLENAQKSYRLTQGVRLTGERVLLVDDVFTTGATANACASELMRGGASRVDVVTAAMVLLYSATAEF